MPRQIINQHTNIKTKRKNKDQKQFLARSCFFVCGKERKVLIFPLKMSIITLTEPDMPLNDADHVGSFNLYGSEKMELKKNRVPMTIDEQVENLKELGLVINDEEAVKEFLNDVSYFRLIKAYSI